MAKKILIIGCGCSGLAAVKCCVDEGLSPVCLERTDAAGGLWNYQEKKRDDQGCVMKTTIINTSKEMMAFSDFPMPTHYPNYTHNTQIIEYFKSYAKAFDLGQYIQYNKEVVHVKPTASFKETGKWNAEIRDHKTGDVVHTEFDGVLVCTGHHAKPNIPKIQGQDGFRGRIVHSRDHKHSNGLEGQRILVVGIGNSGVDVANDVARKASKVYLSTRRGAWVLPRTLDNGLPFDIARTSRKNNWLSQVLPMSLVDGMLENDVNRLYDHKLYCIQPKHRFTAQHPTLSSELPVNIATGRIVMKGDIGSFTKTGVEFEDGTAEDDIDLVVLATGYKIGFPFIDGKVLDIKENRVELYKYMFPPDLSWNTLAVIGCIQPIGAIMPIAEMQCRLATRVFKGDVKLPDTAEMWTEIRRTQTAVKERYTDSPRHTIQVDFVDYMDQLAELVGCKPNVWKYVLTDPLLAYECFFGPCTPFQYRLQGPGSWKQARNKVMTVMSRVKAPFQTRPLPPDLVSGTYVTSVAIALIVVLLALLLKVLLLG